MTGATEAFKALLIERGEVYPPERELKLDAHDREVIRLAELLHEHWFDTLPIRRCVALVYDVLANYRPTVEWTDETPDPELHSDDFDRRMGMIRYITARVRLGEDVHKYMGRIPVHRRSPDEREVESLKRHIRIRLGLSIVEKMEARS